MTMPTDIHFTLNSNQLLDQLPTQVLARLLWDKLQFQRNIEQSRAGRAIAPSELEEALDLWLEGAADLAQDVY